MSVSVGLVCNAILIVIGKQFETMTRMIKMVALT